MPFLHFRGRVIDASETNLEPAGRKPTPASGIYGSKDIQGIKEVSVFQLTYGVAIERGSSCPFAGDDL